VEIQSSALVNRITYRALHKRIRDVETRLRERGVDECDTVLVVADHEIITCCLMLALSRMKCLFSITFKNTCDSELQDKIKILDADKIITVHNDNGEGFSIGSAEVGEGDQVIDFKVISMNRTHKSDKLSKLFEDRALFSLFTSGSKGKPKAIIHSREGYLVFTYITMQHFWEFREQDVMFCSSDAGWVNGHTYSLFGPLLCGGTTVVCKDSRELLRGSTLEDVIKSESVSHLYLPVALVRMARSLNLSRAS